MLYGHFLDVGVPNIKGGPRLLNPRSRAENEGGGGY